MDKFTIVINLINIRAQLVHLHQRMTECFWQCTLADCPRGVTIVDAQEGR